MRPTQPAALLAVTASAFLMVTTTCATSATAASAHAKATSWIDGRSVAQVHKSKDLWVVGVETTTHGSTTTTKDVVEHRHDGHWQVHRYAQNAAEPLGHIVATSTSTAWLLRGPVGHQRVVRVTQSGKLATVKLPQSVSTSQLFDGRGIDLHNVWLVGKRLLDQGRYEAVAAHWSGKKWTVSTLPYAQDPSGTTYYSTDARSVGLSGSKNAVVYGFALGAPLPYVVWRWNGTAWHDTHFPVPVDVGDTWSDIVTSGPNSIHLVGSYYTEVGGEGSTMSAWSYNGHHWSKSRTPPQALNNFMTDAAATSDGAFATGQGYAATYVVRYTHGAWKQMKLPGNSVFQANSTQNGISALSSSNVVVVGHYLALGAHGATSNHGLLMQYDGHKWSRLGTPT